MSSIQEITDADFYDVINSADVPVIIDFWAPWCGPCRAFGPTFEKVAQSTQYQDKILFRKMNVDENSQLPSKMGILGIPTVKIIKKGQSSDDVVVLASKSGALNESALCAFIDAALNS